MCGTGNLQACEVMYAYEMARSGASGGSQVSGGRQPSGIYNAARSHHIRKPENGDSVALQPPRNK